MRWKRPACVRTCIVFIILCFCIALGTRQALADTGLCDTEDVSICYENLVHYEGLSFPMYGAGEGPLDQTCRSINETIECMRDYMFRCDNHPECDENCEEMLVILSAVYNNTGLIEFYEEICEPNKLLRKTYLENYQCLEKNADNYARCHNYSQISQEYMVNIEDPDELGDAKCCFFAWYQSCFINITDKKCGHDATFWVSYSLHILLGRKAESICGPLANCERPPLPDDVIIPLDEDDKTTDIMDNSLDNNSQSRLSSTFLRTIFVAFFVALYAKRWSKFVCQ